MSWYWTENESRPEGKTWQHLIVILGLCFLLYHLESGGGGRVGVGGEGGWGETGVFEIGRQVQGRGKILDVAGQGGWMVLKIGQFSWTSHVYRL